MNNETLVDRFMNKFKNNKVIAFIIVVVMILGAIDTTTNIFVSLKNKLYKLIPNNLYDENKAISLSLALYIMKDAKLMKQKLQKYLNQYPSHVMPYILLYDYYLKINDKNAALLILKKCANKANPRTLKDYYELVSKLYDNKIRFDLQKIY